MTVATERQRIDRWLFFARLAKSRSLAARLVEAGCVRINSIKIEQPAHGVRAGDVVTLRLDRQVRVLRLLSTGARRGPAPEARLLYEELTSPDAPPPGDRDLA